MGGPVAAVSTSAAIRADIRASAGSAIANGSPAVRGSARRARSTQRRACSSSGISRRARLTTSALVAARSPWASQSQMRAGSTTNFMHMSVARGSVGRTQAENSHRHQ